MYLPAPLPRHQRGLPPVVGMLGYAQSGKDTAASRLTERYGFRRVAFADALKRIALDMDPIVQVLPSLSPNLATVRLSDVVYPLGWEHAKRVPEVRRMLQELGVAVRAHLGPDTWVNEVMRQLHRESRGVVITDVRFPNEAAAIREIGGVLVRVIRPGVGPVNQHRSETELDGLEPNWTLENDAGIPELLSRVDQLYYEHLLVA